jgi:hypothetical protein
LNYTLLFVDGGSATPDAIDLYDIKEIVRRLSGSKFTDNDLTRIAEAVDSFFFTNSDIDISNLGYS